MSFDTGEELPEKTSPFDTFIQVIDGSVQITVKKIEHTLALGNGFIIPAHAAHRFIAKEQFKMISTEIKSSYEDESL